MASLATEPLPSLNIDLEKIRKILTDGNDNLCTSNECRKAKIATIQTGKVNISSNPEYKYGDEQALSVYKKCFPSSEKETASCRLCFYKLDDDEKKRKAMLKKPVNKRTGAKSKESHGKTFEGNINECISSYFQTSEENEEAVATFEDMQGTYVKNLLEVFPEKQEISLPMFSNTFIPFLEHPNDPLDVSVHHFHDIKIGFKTEITEQDRIDQQLYPIINTAMDLSSDYKNVAQEELMACMGSGINIKYFESKEKNGKWYPKRMDMANYLTWWNDTRNNADNKITVDELKQIYGPEFNREISFEILPFALMLGCWSEIKDTTTKLEYKCGQGCWIVKFQYNNEDKCPAVNMLWGDPENYGIPVDDFKNLLFQLASVEKKIREEQQDIKNDWLNSWNWPPKDKEKLETGTTKTGKVKYKTIKKKSRIPTNDYMDKTDEEILKLIFRWYGPAVLDGDKINPLGMQSGSAFHNFVNYQDFQAKYIGWSNNSNEIYYEGQTQSLTEIVETIKNAIKTAGGLHTLGPKIFSYKGTEIIDGIKTRNKIKNKKIKEIFPRDCRAPQGNLTGTNIINFLNKMETSGQAIYIEKKDDLYKLFAPIQYDWIDKVTSKIYSLMELKKLYQAIIPSGGGVGDDELEDLLDIVLYDIPDDNTSEFVSVLDNLNKLEYSLRHKNIIPDNPNELLLLDNVKLDIIDVNDRLENVEEEALIHKPFNKIIEICNKDPVNDHLKDVLSWVTQLKKLLMDLIIELKNDLTGKTSIEVWEKFVDTEGVTDVVSGSALAHIVDFHLSTFKNTYQEPRTATRSSVTDATETGKASPPPEKISAEITKYPFQPYQKLEMYLKDYILYEEENKLFLGFQFWKDVVDEIYDRYYQEKDDKDIEIERLKQQLEECLEKLKSDSDSGSDIDIKSNEGNDGRGSDSDDQGSRSSDKASSKISDKASSKSSDKNMSISSDKKVGSAFSGFDNVRSSAESSNSSEMKKQESAKYTGSASSGEKHRKSRRKTGDNDDSLMMNVTEIDDEEEELRYTILPKINGMNRESLQRVNNFIIQITNTSPTFLSRDSVGSITESEIFSGNRISSGSINAARDAFGPQSPGRRKRSSSTSKEPLAIAKPLASGKTLFSMFDNDDRKFTDILDDEQRKISIEVTEFLNTVWEDEESDRILAQIREDFSTDELENIDNRMSKSGQTSTNPIKKFYAYLTAVKNNKSLEINKARNIIKLMISKPGRINITPKAGEEWKKITRTLGKMKPFDTDNDKFLKGENANLKGGKKRRKKSRKRNKKKQKGGTKKKHKYYFKEYI